MTNQEKQAIIAEIERMLAFDGTVSTSYYIGKRDAESELKDFINSLPEPQIPSDVEEAAWQSARVWKDGSKEMFVAPYVRGFKAGAEYERGKYELVYEGNGAIPDERGGYWPTDVKLYRRKEE